MKSIAEMTDVTCRATEDGMDLVFFWPEAEEIEEGVPVELRPLTQRGRDWINRYFEPEEQQWFGGSLLLSEGDDIGALQFLMEDDHLRVRHA